MGMLEFTAYTKPDYEANWHHEQVCKWLDKFVHGEIKRLMVFAPPQHGKSELVSRRLPAYILGRSPDANIITSTYAFDLAQRMGRDVQRIVEDRQYQVLFPGTQLEGMQAEHQPRQGRYLRKSDLFEIVDRKGAYRCTGVGGGITGMGADYGIIDDPVKDDEEAYSATRRAKVLDWYKGTFYTRLRKNAGVLLTMTRWHKNDLAGALLKEAADNPEADQWTVVLFEGCRTDSDNPNDPRIVDEPLWPAFKSRSDLASIRVTLGPTKFAAMYQQRPRREGGAEWPEEFFGPDIWFDEWPSKIWLKAVAWDPSKGKGSKWGDYSAIVKIALTHDGHFYIDADMANDRAIDVMVHTVIELQRRFQPDAVGVESAMFQELLVDIIAEESVKTGVPVAAWPIDHQNVNKEVRIRRLTPFLSLGRFHFKGGSPGTRLLVEQLEEFPNSDHDDGPDALEMGVRLLSMLINGRQTDGLGNNMLDALGVR